jgi:hypothetical protein
VELLPPTLDWLPVEWAITGQAPFSLQDQPGFPWHTDVCAAIAIKPESLITFNGIRNIS